MVAAEKASIPQAVLVPNLYPFPSKGRPMIGSGSMPARGVAGRLRDIGMGAMFRRMFNSGLRPINQARESLGLVPLKQTFDQHARAERLLVLSSEAFDFPGPPLPSNVLYVGPRLNDPEWAEAWNSPWGANDTRRADCVQLDVPECCRRACRSCVCRWAGIRATTQPESCGTARDFG